MAMNARLCMYSYVFMYVQYVCSHIPSYLLSTSSFINLLLSTNVDDFMQTESFVNNGIIRNVDEDLWIGD